MKICIEKELLQLHDFAPSNFRWVMEQVMMDDTGYWKKYYHGDYRAKGYARAYSFSDRCRYYLANPEIGKALKQLIANLDTYGIPLGLLSQYMPRQYSKVRSYQLQNKAEDLLMDRIGDCIDDYLYAVIR